MVDGSTPLVLTCAGGGTITAVTFAAIGTPAGVCGSFAAGACNGDPTKAKAAVSAACMGKTTCSLVCVCVCVCVSHAPFPTQFLTHKRYAFVAQTADIGHFNGGQDPCVGVEKRVQVEVTCSTVQPPAPAPAPFKPPIPPPPAPYHSTQ